MSGGEFRFEIQGFSELAAKFRKAGDIFEKHSKIALQRSLALVLAAAKKEAPVHGGYRSFSPGKKAPGRQGGTLRRSIIIEEINKIGAYVWEGKVGPSVDYGKYVELGTSKMDARPYLFPAIETNRRAIEAIFRKCYLDAIEELKRA